MNATIEKLFDTYGTSVLENTNNFPSREITALLDGLPIAEDARLELLDQINRAYLEWSTNAFTAGLHLGLTLLSDGGQMTRSAVPAPSRANSAAGSAST